MNTMILSAPESVAEQTARLARESAQAKAKADREAMLQRAQAPLIGSIGDLGQRELFGATELFSR